MENNNENNEKTYTEAEFQSEVDKRVTEALKKNEKKLKEAEKLARMNEQEKFQYELEQREKAIAEKEKALTLAENKNEASKLFAEKGLPYELIDLIVKESAEETLSGINNLDKAFKDAVKNEVEKRLASNSPKSSTSEGVIDRDSFNKMTLTEQQALYKANPTLYNALTERN